MDPRWFVRWCSISEAEGPPEAVGQVTSGKQNWRRGTLRSEMTAELLKVVGTERERAVVARGRTNEGKRQDKLPTRLGTCTCVCYVIAAKCNFVPVRRTS